MEEPSEKVQQKAATYLTSGNVKVHEVCQDPFKATLHVTPPAGGDPYVVKHTSAGWQCDCVARVPVCAHIWAAHIIVAPPEAIGERPKIGFGRNSDIDALLGGL